MTSGETRVPKSFSNALVFELNIETNTIMGIGKLNKTSSKPHKIYHQHFYNRHVYSGSERLDNSDFSPLLLTLCLYLEEVFFKGKSHLKRGNGINPLSKKIREHILYNHSPILSSGEFPTVVYPASRSEIGRPGQNTRGGHLHPIEEQFILVLWEKFPHKKSQLFSPSRDSNPEPRD